MGDVDPSEKKLSAAVDGDEQIDEKRNGDEEKKEATGGGLINTQEDGEKQSKMMNDGKDIVEDETLFRSLQQLPFYHGFLPREDLRTLLRNDGDYLIRVSEVTVNETQKKSKKEVGNEKEKEKEVPSIKRDLILSVFESSSTHGANAQQSSGNQSDNDKSGMQFGGKLRNMVVRRYNGKFGIELSISFDTITDLLNHYHSSNTGETKKNRFLKNPIKLQVWELRHVDIKLGGLLGEGAYGEVRTGVLTRKGREVEVAVKLMKGQADLNKIKIREMMKEARLMRAFKHRNIVRFYGVAVDEQPLYIILELVHGGALNTFLQKNKKIPALDLMNMCYGAASGLQYLHYHNCIHRDIAARNCLYTNDKVVKLSDFGLSRVGNAYKLCTSQKLPIKWLAAETITTLYFTFKTDVYSYGVMCYEIFSEGEEPWENVTNTEAKRNVVTGKYLTIPDRCPEKFRVFVEEKIYVKDPKKRVTMEDVVRFIEPILNEMSTFNDESKCEKKEQKEQKSDAPRSEAPKSEAPKSEAPKSDAREALKSTTSPTVIVPEALKAKMTTQKRNKFKTAKRTNHHHHHHN